MIKLCRKCGIIKRIGDFTFNSKKRGARKAECRACANARSSRYYRENREVQLAKMKARRDDPVTGEIIKERKRKHNATEKGKASQRKRTRKHYEENRQDYIDRAKAWEKKQGPEYKRARASKYRHENRDKCNEHLRGKRAKLGSFSWVLWRERLNYYDGKCVYCGSEEKIEIEHRIPVSRGGTNLPANLVPACMSCNRSKGTMTESEYKAKLCS